MSSKFIEHSPEPEGDKALIIIMDGEGNVTADPEHFEKIISSKQLPEMGIKIVRLDANQTESESDGDADKPELKLTVEEIYPDNVTLTTSNATSNVLTPPLEILPGTSGEHIGHDIIDPFSQMDPEQLERLEHALASEQAKQILGENVAAILDMLGVDDSPAAILQNSIKNDHCYTNLLPSSDPNGPSFFLGDTRASNSDSSMKGKGKAKAGTPVKGKKVVISSSLVGNSSSPVKRPPVKEQPSPVKPQVKQSIVDYGMPVGLPQLKPQDEVEDPTYEEDVDIEDIDSEASGGVEDDNLSDEDYRSNDRSQKKKRKPKRNRKKLLVKRHSTGRPPGRPSVSRPGGRGVRKSGTSEEIRARNEKLDDEMAKVVQSLEFSPKMGDHKFGHKKDLKKMKIYKKKKSGDEAETGSEKIAKEAPPKPAEESPAAVKAQNAKYPKRENRKPPAHLAEAFGPALFSTPDIIRRISSSDEVPQTASEKKNFTVGVQKTPSVVKIEGKPDAVPENRAKKSESDLNESDNTVVKKVKSKESLRTTQSLLKSVAITGESEQNVEVQSVVPPSVLSPTAVSVLAPVAAVSPEKVVVTKKPNLEIQKLIERHQSNPPKQIMYEEDQDYSDENIEDNYYLDPTQMDQSLLEGFGPTTSKSEEQLLQEAILLQEQYGTSQVSQQIQDPIKMILDPTTDAHGEMEETFMETQDVPGTVELETIDNIQNEISSALMPSYTEAQQKALVDDLASRTARQSSVDQPGFIKQAGNPDPLRVNNPTGENQIEMENQQLGSEEGNLVVDDKKRNSTKRRRSDEVSDLDSDLDDALSEASWNSEDDPDRLWCICRKPHNNRFMICCDVCEEWFHGKCVGITKILGKQMEQDGLEWSCPNCTRKKKSDEMDKESEKIKLLKEKMAQSIKDQQLKLKENQRTKNPNPGGKEKPKFPKTSNPSDLKQMKISDYSHKTNEEESGGRKCIMCKGPVRENSVYCSDDCIRKHSQRTLSQTTMSETTKKVTPDGFSSPSDGSKPAVRPKKEVQRIILMNTGKKVLVTPQSPTSFKGDKGTRKVLTSPKIVRIQPKPTGDPSQKLIQVQPAQKLNVSQSEPGKSTQLKLTVSPNSKHVKIVHGTPGTSAQGKKQIFQIVSASPASGAQKSGTILVRQKQTEIIEALPMPIKVLPGKGTPVKVVKTEITSPKSSTSKELPTPKQEKIVRKRKEKVPKMAATSTTLKDLKASQLSKQEDPREKDRDRKDTDQQIRESVRKTLAETLKVRVQECKEMEFNEEHIDGLALKIEEKLFKNFENKIDMKYKSKYRSLVFNIKDPKNETLFRKIVDNSISPKELVKLSPEELASQELARWREKENQHQLEMIKKTELELMTIGNTYIMKSHKGEQVIESEKEKVATVAVEIDPNTPAQELVSALNSVSSTTQDAVEDEEKGKGDLETTLMKMRKKEKEKRRDKSSRKHKREREHKRSSRSSSRSRSRSHRSKDKKRSRSRDRDKERERGRDKDRDRDRSKHRHKEKKLEKSDKESEDALESVEEKLEDKLDKHEISTSEDMEEKVSLKKHMLDAFDDADHEPSSTVNIKTPDINIEESDPVHLWKGTIVMADVAKFRGVATEVSGDCSGLSSDIGDKVDVVGRIPFDTVWDYIARMKKMATKDILVIKIVPSSDEEKISYVTLYSYLAKRNRIGVIGKTSETVKDFYLYPLASHSPIPQVLLPLGGPGFEDDREHILLGIIVRSRHRAAQSKTLDSAPLLGKTKKAAAAIETESKSPLATLSTLPALPVLPVPDSQPDRSYTPPLPDKEKGDLFDKKDPRLKRKIRVQIDYKPTPKDEDDDSPYSPGDSDDDLPPLPKISKPSIPSIPTSITKLLSPVISGPDSNLQDPAEIQRKIEEMNRAIEEQTQQIQNLTSTVPNLAAAVPLATIPLLASVTSGLLAPSSSLSPHAIPLPSSSTSLLQTPPASEKPLQPPVISLENDDERYSPSRSFTPPPKTEENIPFLPEVTSKISLPSNLQEILNSIQKKSGDTSDPEDTKIKSPDMDIVNVINQTKTLLSNLATIPKPVLKEVNEEKKEKEKEKDDTPILSRLSDEDIIRKAQEMELEVKSAEAMSQMLAAPAIPCVEPLPPGVDLSVPPPVIFPLIPPPAIVPPDEKRRKEVDEKKPEKKTKLDTKSIFETEGVTDFVSTPAASWEEKRGQKSKGFKIDIRLGTSAEKKTIDMDHFDIESISNVPEMTDVDERQLPSCSLPQQSFDESKFDIDERIPPKPEEKLRRGSSEKDRRRSEDWDGKRGEWKHDRRHYDDERRYKDDHRRHGRRDRPKFRKEDKRDRHLEKEWEKNIKDFEERQRRRNLEIRREESKLRKRADSSSK